MPTPRTIDAPSPHRLPRCGAACMCALAALQLAAGLLLAWCALEGHCPPAVVVTTAAIGVASGFASLVTRRRMRAHQAHVAGETGAVLELATMVAQNAEVAGVMTEVCRVVTATCGSPRAVLVRFLPGDGAEVVGASAGAGVYPGQAFTLAPGGAADRCRALGETVRGPGTVFADHPGASPVDALPALAIPCRVDGELWGCLVASDDSRQAVVDAHDAAVMEQVSLLAGLAVANAGHRQALEVRAATDPLTGLTNHPTFRQLLDNEVARAQRHQRSLSLMIIDVDRFSRVNDSLGHRGGDRVLVDLADMLRAEARTEDVIARIGGQEFAWLMPDCSSLSAWNAAERLRGAVTRGPLGGLTGLTISAGTCDLAHAEGTGARLFELASGALYWAKQNGRAMSVRYSPDVVLDLSASERAARLERGRALDAVRLLAQAVDARDPHTQRHSERVADVSAALARCLGWDEDAVRRLHEAGLVHDVGKIGIPDSVLLKNGPLDDAERARIETHAALGAQMVSDVLTPEQTSWVRGHHERWDGHGYPDQLSADGIPSGARLMAVADAFDAMVSDRPYRRGLGVETAHDIIRDGSGGQFCPQAVDAFNVLMARGEIAAIYESPDSEGSPTASEDGGATPER